jgi:hypothetical protein
VIFGSRVDVVASHNRGGQFIEPSLGVGLLGDVPRVLLACLVTIVGATTLDHEHLSNGSAGALPAT